MASYILKIATSSDYPEYLNTEKRNAEVIVARFYVGDFPWNKKYSSFRDGFVARRNFIHVENHQCTMYYHQCRIIGIPLGNTKNFETGKKSCPRTILKLIKKEECVTSQKLVTMVSVIVCASILMILDPRHALSSTSRSLLHSVPKTAEISRNFLPLIKYFRFNKLGSYAHHSRAIKLSWFLYLSIFFAFATNFFYYSIFFVFFSFFKKLKKFLPLFLLFITIIF